MAFGFEATILSSALAGPVGHDRELRIKDSPYYCVPGPASEKRRNFDVEFFASCSHNAVGCGNELDIQTPCHGKMYRIERA